jgi:hypothetical protein
MSAQSSNIPSIMTQLGTDGKVMAPIQALPSRATSPEHKIDMPVHQMADTEARNIDFKIVDMTIEAQAVPKSVPATQTGYVLAAICQKHYTHEIDQNWFRGIWRPTADLITLRLPAPFLALIPGILPPYIFVASPEHDKAKWKLEYAGESTIKKQQAAKRDNDFYLHVKHPASCLLSMSTIRDALKSELGQCYIVMGTEDRDWKVMDDDSGRIHIGFTIEDKFQHLVPDNLHKLKRIYIDGDHFKVIMGHTFWDVNKCNCKICFKLYKTCGGCEHVESKSEAYDAFQRGKKSKNAAQRKRKMAAAHDQEGSKF